MRSISGISETARGGRFLLPVALCLLASAAWAQPALELERTGGPFSQYTRRGAWQQRFAVINNRHDQPRRAKVSFVADAPEGGTAIYSRSVTVPGGARRIVLVDLNAGQAPPTGRVIGQRVQVGLSAELVDTARDQRLMGVPVESLLLEPDVTAMALIHQPPDHRLDEDDNLEYLDHVDGEPLGEVLQLRQGIGDLPTLPTQWMGYDALDIVVLGRFDPTRLPPATVTALLDWTRRGGTLILAGHDNVTETLRGRFARLAGVRAVGYHRRESLSGTGPDGEAFSAALPWAAPMAELLATDAEVLWRADGLPLITRKPLGDGWVFVSALPLGALADPALHEIWNDVRAVRARRPVIDAGQFAAAGEVALAATAGRPAPPRSVPATVGIALAALVLVGGGALVWRGQGEWLWILLVPLCILLAGAGYGWSLLQTEPERISHVGVIRVMGDGQVRIREMLAYHAPAGGRDVSPSAGTSRGIIVDRTASTIAAMARRETATGGAMTLPDRSVPGNGALAFSLDVLVDRQTLTGQASFGPDGVTATMTNHMPVPVQSAVLLAGRRTYRVGDLPVGEANWSAGPEDDLGPVRLVSRGEVQGARGGPPFWRGEFTASLIHSPTDTLRNQLLTGTAELPGLMATPRLGGTVQETPMLVGYVDWLAPEVLPGRDLPHRGWSVLAMPLELTAPPSGTPVVVPGGLLDVNYRGATLFSDRLAEFLKLNMSVVARMTITPPPALAELQSPVLVLEVDIAGREVAMECSGLVEGRPGRAESIASLDAPAGPQTIRIESAERFRDRHGTYHLKLDVRTPPLDPANPDVDRSWQFKSVRVRLEGIAK